MTAKIIEMFVRLFYYVAVTNLLSIALFSFFWPSIERNLPKYVVMRPRLSGAVALIPLTASFAFVIYLGFPYWIALYEEGVAAAPK